MPSFIVKADPDTDLYAEWSTISDSPAKIGNREWMLVRGISSERLDRADAKGSSALGDISGWYSWDDDSWIYKQEGVLPRTNLREALERLRVSSSASIQDLLLPFEDEE